MKACQASYYRDDCRRWGRDVAEALYRTAKGTADAHDAEALRRQLESLALQVAREHQARARSVRARLGLKRGSLENLMSKNARPVAGGALLIIDGGRRA